APLVRGRSLAPAEVLDWWRATRARTVAALRGHDAKDRIPWVANEMSTVSFATARLMETWAHGQDVVDALRVRRAPSGRLRHIAHLGVTTRAFSYLVRGRVPPEVPVRVELTGPSGDVWPWGPRHPPGASPGGHLDPDRDADRRGRPRSRSSLATAAGRQRLGGDHVARSPWRPGRGGAGGDGLRGGTSWVRRPQRGVRHRDRH